MAFVACFRKKLTEFLRSMQASSPQALLCSECFIDRGLTLEARKIGRRTQSECPQCHSRAGVKLDSEALDTLSRTFFLEGSFFRTEYGGARTLTFGDPLLGDSDVKFAPWLQPDVQLIQQKGEIGFRYYAPATWRIGEIGPLEDLRNDETQKSAAEDVIKRFPQRTLAKGDTFYRLRKNVEFGRRADATQYDSPPKNKPTTGRLDDVGFNVLYGSQDLEICVHECRITKADECYLATLQVSRPLQLLDLCGQLSSDGDTPFESLYIAIQLIFEAESHSYGIARAIARAARAAALDGIAYPSYFSSLRGDTIPNIALFGRPIAEGSVNLMCVDRLLLNRVTYELSLGPCLIET